MRVLWVPLIWSVLASPALATGVEVRVSSGRVDLKTAGAPLSEVLDQLSTSLGFKLLRDSGVPNPQLPALELKGRTPVETVIAVLEGQGLNYAFAMDPSGTQIEMLILTVAVPPQPARAPTPPPVRGRIAPYSPRPPVSSPIDEEDEPDEPPMPESPALPEPEPEEPPTPAPGPSSGAPPPRPAPGSPPGTP